MADFGRPYYSPMDQQYHHEVQNADKRTSNTEQPIFPISSIGQTVPERDQLTGRGFLQGVDAAFRAGAGNVQLVMQQPGQATPIGGGPKAYGEEIRREIRELQKAAGARVTGVELPTSMGNLSGFNPGNNTFSEEQKKLHLDEVRDTIKFIGDISGGGGVDIVAMEFPRNFSDASWSQQDKDLFKQREREMAMLVNTETGKVSAIDKRQKFHLFIDPNNPGTREQPNFVDESHLWTWKNFEKWGEKEKIAPEILFVTQQSDFEKRRLIREAYANEVEARTRREMAGKTSDTKEKEFYETVAEKAEEMSRLYKQQAKQVEDEQYKFRTVSEYGEQQSTDSYAQAGIWAMQESLKNQFVQKGKGTIHVGPELGWPTYYGGHPREWVDLIKNAREQMVNKLTQKIVVDSATNEEIRNPNFDPSISRQEAEKLAKEHIKGELDTSHMGMWIQSFRPELSWDKRVEEFKKWYKQQIEFLAEENKKHDLIGGIQVVDSASGAHGHLPPGEGLLGKDIFEYMKILKEKGGYKGDFTSEGHEEETSGRGRILTKAWETFGSPISMGYFEGRAAPAFRSIAQNYAQTNYGSTGIFQSYVPSNDFTLWSNVPLE